MPVTAIHPQGKIVVFPVRRWKFKVKVKPKRAKTRS